nr:MAG TPA: hypothetical protein [Caudoviricetes sp.]
MILAHVLLQWAYIIFIALLECSLLFLCQDTLFNLNHGLAPLPLS